MDFGGCDDVRFEKKQHCGVIILTRPKALNTINNTMVEAISAALDAWQNDADIQHILIKGEGRAFSAGGDLLDLYKNHKSGDLHYGFFRSEYRLNARMGNYPKPIIALINGIVMGGGVGISVHGRYRVMTENAIFAMPEVGIGFFPDVGGSHFLPRLPRKFGHFLALTGERVRVGDAIKSGLATHYVPADALGELEDALTTSMDAADILEQHAAGQPCPPAKLDHDEIERLFSFDSLSAIIDSLQVEQDTNPVAQAILAALLLKSPTSVAVAHRQLRDGAHISLADCMRMEYRILVQMLQGHEFYEGIRAVIIDKCNEPIWQPATLAEVSQQDVDAYFTSLGPDELTGVMEAT